MQLKQKRRNIHKIEQLAWGSSKFAGIVLISDQFITLITHPLHDKVENIKHPINETFNKYNPYSWITYYSGSNKPIMGGKGRLTCLGGKQTKICRNQTKEWSWYILCSNPSPSLLYNHDSAMSYWPTTWNLTYSFLKKLQIISFTLLPPKKFWDS